jgi:hypothetical protein
MAFIDALAALCLNRRDLTYGQRHRRPAIWAGRSAETIYANLGPANPGLLHGAVELSRFGGRAAIVGGCDLRQRFVFSAEGREGARRPTPIPDGFGRARHRSCYDKHDDTHSALEVVARRTRGTDVLELKRVAAVAKCRRLTSSRASMPSDMDAATQAAAKI